MSQLRLGRVPVGNPAWPTLASRCQVISKLIDQLMPLDAKRLGIINGLEQLHI